MTDFDALVSSAPQNLAIVDTLLKAKSVLERHRLATVSVSGGSDSDIMLDLIELVRPHTDCDVRFVFFNTGLEYRATLRHLDELEIRYGVTIDRRRPKKPIPTAIREYGIPFLSKDTSQRIGRLQKHGFNWHDTRENATVEKYGRVAEGIEWWFATDPKRTVYSVTRHKLLREYIMQRSPPFQVSDQCCTHVKKHVAAAYQREVGADLSVVGMRRAEGGRRATSIKTCYTASENAPDTYRPLWFWTDTDKAAYKAWRNIRYSDCYEVWGFKRTGCVGCPFNSKAELELEIAERYEPQLVKAARSIFGASYEYRRGYETFKRGATAEVVQ
jgi:3'-phosphoadenosine 5'-phosphosulfate sulfotransferase (PAPS reductase)/FAD synthetase